MYGKLSQFTYCVVLIYTAVSMIIILGITKLIYWWALKGIVIVQSLQAIQGFKMKEATTIKR